MTKVPFLSFFTLYQEQKTVRDLNLLSGAHKLSSLALSLSHTKTKMNGTHQLLQIILIHYSQSGDTQPILSSGLLKPSADFPSSAVVQRRIRKTGLIKIHALYWNIFLH